MDNEDLFAMLDTCISLASQALSDSQKLDSFAMVLEHDNSVREIELDETDGHTRYQTLIEILKMEAEAEKITAFALLSNVDIPENFSPEVSTGIRIHIEEKDFKAENKLSARLLYIPYQLYRTKDDPSVQVRLHDPIPVGLPCEIFV